MLKSGLTLFFLAVCFASAVRWGLRAHDPQTVRFQPRPDALEYAAAAQALALEARYVLHVGPLAVRPRYSPGWPLILAPAVRLGVPAERLWYVTGLFSALHAGLIAVIAFVACHLYLAHALRRAGSPDDLGPLFAGLVAGVGWSLTPASLVWSSVLMSDEAAAFFANAALVLLAGGLLGRLASHDDGRASLLCFGGGLMAGVAATVRPISAVLLVAPLIAFLVGTGAVAGWRGAGRRLAWCCGGAVAPVAIASLTMVRSGYLPWQWSGYGFWLPEIHHRFSNVFNASHALSGSPHGVAHTGGQVIPHLRLAANLLLGIPIPGQAGLGEGWPWLAWLSAAILAAGALWRSPRPAAATLALVGGVAGWIAGHAVVFALYYFPGTRFYLAVLPWIWISLAAGLGVLCQLIRTPLLMLVFIASTWVGYRVYSSARPLLSPARTMATNEELRVAFAQWMALPAGERRLIVFPLDPVEAQALGLLTPAVLRQIEASVGPDGWGRLPTTEHVERLRARGFDVP